MEIHWQIPDRLIAQTKCNTRASSSGQPESTQAIRKRISLNGQDLMEYLLELHLSQAVHRIEHLPMPGNPMA